MRSKTGLNLTKNYSFNFSLPKRRKKLIKFIVIHYTGMKNESEAIKRLKDHRAKVSAHYFIKNSGHILNMVPNLYEAWHAGRSEWKNFKSLNRYSIGIEINNPGHDYGYKSFSSKQIFSLQKLLKILMKNYRIKPENVLGHSDIAPNRKKDPGEKFPWDDLYKDNLCHGYDLNKKVIKKFRKIRLNLIEEKIFFNNLYKIGYSRNVKPLSKKNKVTLIKVFQSRFRQELVNGEIDKECFLISKNL